MCLRLSAVVFRLDVVALYVVYPSSSTAWLCTSMKSGAGLPSLNRGCACMRRHLASRPRIAPPPSKSLTLTSYPHLTRKHSAREEAIAIEMVKNLREKVSWCQREHPVTHYYDCADIVGKYLKLVKVRRKQGGRERGRKGNEIRACDG